jgi:hypothetical protein
MHALSNELRSWQIKISSVRFKFVSPFPHQMCRGDKISYTCNNQLLKSIRITKERKRERETETETETGMILFWRQEYLFME